MTLFTKVTGSGPAVILLHGFCEDHSIWSNVQKDLESDYTVINLDLPGFGQSSSLKSPFTMNEVAESVYNSAKHHVSPPYTVIGHSLGGYVTLAFAENYEKDIAGFGLFHSTAYADTKEKKANRNKTIEFIHRNGTAPFVEMFVPGLFYENNQERFHQEINELKERTRPIDPLVIIDYTKAMRDRPDRTHILYNSDVPVLFIAGEKDPAVPFKDSLAQSQQLENDHVHFLENTGHMGMIESYPKSLKTLRQFLEKVYF